MKVSGALCLMSDLTELTALQKQIRWKENLAALGEMSAGIAHEFKNALATISGYAQMIRSEARPGSGDIRESAERILDQTRALTHVVTEFLRFAKPLEICYETVPMKTLVERVTEELRESNPGCAVECEGAFEDLPASARQLDAQWSGGRPRIRWQRPPHRLWNDRRAGWPEVAADLHCR
jgi:signal transduction histidine kinase